MRSPLRIPMKSFALRFYRSDQFHIGEMGQRPARNSPANLTRKDTLSATGGSDINIILALLDRTRDVPGMWPSAAFSRVPAWQPSHFI
jgi:hypothetical protein